MKTLRLLTVAGGVPSHIMGIVIGMRVDMEEGKQLAHATWMIGTRQRLFSEKLKSSSSIN